MKPSELIDKQIAEHNDWRGELLKVLREIILEAEPEIKEDWRWETAVWVRVTVTFVRQGFLKTM